VSDGTTSTRFESGQRCHNNNNNNEGVHHDKARGHAVTDNVAGLFRHDPWVKAAACHGLTHIFFPRRSESGTQRDAREAKAIAVCATCPVIEQCKQQRPAEVEHGGVWGGISATASDGIIHGTYAGYRRHIRQASAPCDPCRMAYNAYQARAKVQRNAVRIALLAQAAAFRDAGGHNEWAGVA
jgi:Transcription factor WhiB